MGTSVKIKTKKKRAQKTRMSNVVQLSKEYCLGNLRFARGTIVLINIWDFAHDCGIGSIANQGYTGLKLHGRDIEAVKGECYGIHRPV